VPGNKLTQCSFAIEAMGAYTEVAEWGVPMLRFLAVWAMPLTLTVMVASSALAAVTPP
jgi:hypothetical protein